MFPFQNNNPFFPLNVDLSTSQTASFTSQYLSKTDLPTRIPQIYSSESHSPYTNLPSLLNKRPSPVELSSAPVKILHQDLFPFPPDIYGLRELPKLMVTAPKPEDLNAQKLLFRAQPELFGVPKGLSLNIQQIPGLVNGLGLPTIDLTSAETQQYLGENASQAYIRQYLESKGLNAREYGAQMQQPNEGIQRYLGSLYGLQNGVSANPANLGLHNLTGIEGLGSLGNLAGLGGFGNLGNLGNLGQPGMLDLINQMRNQQMLQQLNQSLSMQLLPSLQEAARNDPNFRNSSWADLMLLNQAHHAQQQNNLMNSLQTLNMGPSPIQKSISPPSSKGIAQTLPEPVRQQEVMVPRKDSINSSSKLLPMTQESNEVRTMPFGAPEAKYKAQDKVIKNKPELEYQGKSVRQEKELERSLARPSEARPKKNETFQHQQLQPQNVRIHSNQQNQQLLPLPSEITTTEMSEKTKNKLYMYQEQPEKVARNDKLTKKVANSGHETPQRKVQNSGEAELTRQTTSLEAQNRLKNRKSESERLEEIERAGNGCEKMNLEARKLSVLTDPQNEFLLKIQGQKIAENGEHQEHERIDPIPPVTGLNRDHSLTGEINTHQNAVGENFYQTPERIEEEHVPQKIVETRVGFQFQTELPELALNDEYEEEALGNRKCKLNWDPDNANSKEIVEYLKNLHRILNTKVINQERALQLLAKKNFDVEEVLNHIKKNERHYSNFFGISNCTRELRSRRSIE